MCSFAEIASISCFFVHPHLWTARIYQPISSSVRPDLLRQDGPPAAEPRLREVRPAHWDGQPEPCQHGIHHEPLPLIAVRRQLTVVFHRLKRIRSEEVGSKEFREIVSEIASLMCYEASRDLKLQDVKIKMQIYYKADRFRQNNLFCRKAYG